MSQKSKMRVSPSRNDSRLRLLEKRIEELEGKLYHVAEIVSHNARLLHPAFTQVDANVEMLKSVVEDLVPGDGVLPKVDWQHRYDAALEKVLKAQGKEDETSSAAPDTEPVRMEAEFGGDYGE
jgi:hypothetical protein